MSLWLIRPRDSVVLRDGRPFGPDPGARATSLAFPFPSTTTGAVRTRFGLANGGFGDNGVTLEEVKKWRVRGPLLTKLDELEPEKGLLLPRPHDALLLPVDQDDSAAPNPTHPGVRQREPGQANPDKAARLWLRPLKWPVGATSNLPADLAPIGPERPRTVKPLGDMPVYWSWSSYRQWLATPGDGEVKVSALGSLGPTRESRMHVRVTLETQTATDGMLFQTSGMEFIRRRQDALWWQVNQCEELGLLVETDAPFTEGTGVLGGEGRMVAWQQVNGKLPECPSDIAQAVLDHKACRLVLVTPAHFANPTAGATWGHLPNFSWLTEKIKGLRVKIVGAIVQGVEVISGWSYEKPVGPKKTRRLVPAGSVFWLSLDGSSPEAIQAFLIHTWMQSISDLAQDRLDGFGLTLVGTWRGDLLPMKLEGHDGS